MYELKCPNCMTPQVASGAACSVCGTAVNDGRGSGVPNSSIFDRVEKPLAQPILFPISLSKFIVMNLATLGLYQIFWAFKSWHYYASVGHSIRPGWRAWLSFFYLHSLLKEILATGKAVGLSDSYSPTRVFVPWLILQLAARLPDPIWLVSFFTFVPLISVLRYVNEINRSTGKGDSINSKFSPINWFGIVVGSVIVAVTVWSAFTPEK